MEHSQELSTTAIWRKSTATDTDTCVEVALRADLVLVRDSKDAEGPRLGFTPSSWTGFLDTLR